MTRKSEFFGGCLLAGLLSAAFAAPAVAATVAQAGTSDLVDLAQFVFHGTVQSHRVLRLDDSGTIVTRVSFRVKETVKGPPRDETLDLDFLGGSLDGVRLEVPGLVIPPVGEEGVYFVEQLEYRQVNPILGWWQGRFPVRHDAAGRRVVLTHDLESIFDFVPRTSLERGAFSVGAAEGVVTQPTESSSRPLSLEDFKTKLRLMLGEPR